ncbi:MAG: hypothetical protein JWO04_4467 [Gammaproteobacteria bacterium]|nr:hypothetical protein [Gammaproteobacteria bacterium]
MQHGVHPPRLLGPSRLTSQNGRISDCDPSRLPAHLEPSESFALLLRGAKADVRTSTIRGLFGDAGIHL